MMQLPVEEENVVFYLVLSIMTEGESGLEAFSAVPDRELALDGLWSYIKAAIESGDTSDPAMVLFEMMISIVESAKYEYPDIAARIRKMNLQHFKSKKDDKSTD